MIGDQHHGPIERLALDAGCDILPCGISGTIDALPKGTWKFSNEYSAMRILVGEVISTRGLGDKDLDGLIARCRDTVIALKDELDGRMAQTRAAA